MTIGQPARVLIRSDYTLGEGPLWRGDIGTLSFVDIEGRAVIHYRWATGVSTHDETLLRPCALFELGDDAIALVLEDRLELAGAVVDPGLSPGVRFNDGKVDPFGRFWVGTMDRAEMSLLGSLYVLESGRLHERARGFAISNGLGWSPDGRTMYQSDTLARRILVWDFGPDDTSIVRRGEIDLSWLSGMPDGLSTDAEGNLWIAFWGAGRVRCVSPAGVVLAEITVPTSDVTSCCFAGPERDALVITTARRDRHDEELAGSVFTADPGVTGAAVSKWRGN